ncbi:hypothetical protein DDB_G0287239 [Dictyostelium discoideum AX4]|uniref:THH1/TOM1/TOM3 domain-containing protein n=1 Tax=Dictyostelium discoideum TaxID=44689 RepID=Q54KM4_DICDI|nr:hypothetical protein DDB_G0287239 [Dictyostelium discoideum AX4]EAL63821.1 hypothetical protein DDB_G0287239 [Dictyostelium discoideum AX4]|eukprot:XP_637333.1 hypothetical protein DDB_G0287239 [Dictyostelium discoideum AX4]
MAITNAYYDYSHIALISLYTILAILSIISFIRSTILLIASLLRAVSFSLFIINEEKVKEIDGNLLFLTNELPSFFYLTFFSMALLLSIQIFQGTLVVKAVDMQKLKTVVIIANVVIYLILAILFILDFVLFPYETASVDQPTSVFQMIIQFIAAFIYFITAVTFFVFLFKTYYEHYDDKFADAVKTQESVQLKKRSNGIIFFSFLCFLIRAIMTCLTIFLKLGFWYKDLVYYLFFEIIPISLLLFIINEMTYKAGNIVFGGHQYSEVTENSRLTETSNYLIAKYSNSQISNINK